MRKLLLASIVAGISMYSMSAYACTADCSPGYYKNHPEAWCDVACPAYGGLVIYNTKDANAPYYNPSICTDMVAELSARGPGSEAIRDAAKADIDFCFGTWEASPCMDDDVIQ